VYKQSGLQITQARDKICYFCCLLCVLVFYLAIRFECVTDSAFFVCVYLCADFAFVLTK